MLNSEIQCLSHPDAYQIEDSRAGDVICSECGLVLLDRCIDVSAEWRTFQDEIESSSRVGHLQESSSHEDLSTYIANKNQVKKTFLNKSSQKRIKARSCLKDFADRISADRSVISLAENYFEKTNKLISASIEEKSAACLFIALQHNSVGRSFKEISGVTNVPIRRLGALVKKLSLEIKSIFVETSHLTSRTDCYIERYCSKLDYPLNVRKLALHIFQQAKEAKELASKNPNSLAGAAIYLAAERENIKIRSLNDISQICCVAESTINRTIKTIKETLKF